jgi:hypothetical protein
VGTPGRGSHARQFSRATSIERRVVILIGRSGGGGLLLVLHGLQGERAQVRQKVIVERR